MDLTSIFGLYFIDTHVHRHTHAKVHTYTGTHAKVHICTGTHCTGIHMYRHILHRHTHIQAHT